MKTKSKLISVTATFMSCLLVASCSWLTTYTKAKAPKTNLKSSNIRAEDFYIYLFESKSFSLNIYKSDYVRNYYALQHLVGTLFKEDNSGKYKPYLVKSLSTSSDKKKWEFSLHKNLTCEDGEQITASSFSHNLTASLRRYTKQSTLLEFKKLIGSELLSNPSNKTIPGITYSQNKLILEFSTPPEKLLQRLADPYFGYLCSENFNSDQFTWKNDLSIISSGPFRLKNAQNPKHLTLELRNSYPLSKNSQVKRLHLISSKDSKFFRKQYSLVRMPNEIPNIPGMTFFEGVPSFTISLSIPFKGRKNLSNKTFRKHLFDRFYQLKKMTPPSGVGVVPTNSFFPMSKTDFFSSGSQTKTPPPRFTSKKTLIVSMSSSIVGKARTYLLETLNIIGLEMNFKTVLRSKSKIKKTTLPNRVKSYDLRFTMVDMGSAPYFSLLDMVFCSKLGVGYPDPSGRLCKFIKDNLANGGGDLTVKDQKIVYDIISKDASALPIYHKSISVYFSPEIDLNSISGASNMYRADLIRFVK